jgi:galactose mutarotase-like enzyme
LPYRLEKAVRLEAADVVIDYTLVNRGDADLEFLWSAHPLLTVEPGSRIMLPSDVDELFVNYSSQNRLGSFGSTCRWPVVRSTRGEERIDMLRPPSVGLADKLFTSRLSEGSCGLYKPESKECISFRFDPATVPFIGLWICQGGWPSPAHGHYTVALEPCTGRPDSLEIAIARRENALIRAREEKSWTLRLSLGPAPPDRF